MTLKFAAVTAIAALTLCANISTRSAAQTTAPVIAPAMPAGNNPLGLTPDQQQRALARKQQMAADIAALRNDQTLTDQQKQAKFIGLEKRFQSDMLAILTPAQRAQFTTEVAKRQAIADVKMKAFLDVQTKLRKSMTKDQQAQIKSISISLGKQAQSIVQDKTLTDDDKRTKIQALQKEQEAEVNAILTPTQRIEFAKLQAMIPVGPSGPPH